MKLGLSFHPVGAGLLIVALSCLAPPSAGAATENAYLTPDLKVGEHLSDVFAKIVSIKGDGFKEYVKRVGGNADYVVTSVTPDAIVMDETYRYDGYGEGSSKGARFLSDGMTQCSSGKCAVDNETSGLLFNPLLWGKAPDNAGVGTVWRVDIAKPWEIGPPGTEQVRVARLDPLNHAITLTRTGSGQGSSSDDEALRKSGKQIDITTKEGKTMVVSLVPGATHWSGYTTICRGVIVGDVIVVQRHVTLIAKTGERFEGEQRSYTLLNLAQDTLAGSRAATGRPST